MRSSWMGWIALSHALARALSLALSHALSLALSLALSQGRRGAPERLLHKTQPSSRLLPALVRCNRRAPSTEPAGLSRGCRSSLGELVL